MSDTNENLEVRDINLIIESQYCDKTFKKLTNSSYNKECMKSSSTKKLQQTLREKLEKEIEESDKVERILNDILDELIKPGVKGGIKGRKFNELIRIEIEKMKLDKERFTVTFEHKVEEGENPDWLIEDKVTGKKMVGMNQLDLWTGGEQYNRGDKYVIQQKDISKQSKEKIVAVVCNKKKIAKKGTKIYNLFNIGFKNNTLCYIKGLKKIINEFFEI